MNAVAYSWFVGFFAFTKNAIDIRNCTNHLAVVMTHDERSSLDGRVPGMFGFALATHNQTYMKNCTYNGVYDSGTFYLGIRVRRRRFSGFIGEVKANTTLENCTFSGNAKSMSENNVDCGAGMALYAIAPYDGDYSNNDYVLRFSLVNFHTTANAVLHDYYFEQVINPLIGQIYVGWN